MSVNCPLCRRTGAPLDKFLYGTPVCRKCSNGFANRRQFAYVLDWLFWIPVTFVFGIGLAAVGMVVGQDQLLFQIVTLLAHWILLPFLFVCKDGFRGQSAGKAIMGVQVVDRELLMPIGFGASFKRNLILMVPFMPLVVAFLLMKGYRVGDGWAKSKVVWKKYAAHPLFAGGSACENCQYDLTGNTTGICSECGTPVPVGAQVFTPDHPPTTRGWSPIPGMPPMPAAAEPTFQPPIDETREAA